MVPECSDLGDRGNFVTVSELATGLVEPALSWTASTGGVLFGSFRARLGISAAHQGQQAQRPPP